MFIKRSKYTQNHETKVEIDRADFAQMLKIGKIWPTKIFIQLEQQAVMWELYFNPHVEPR